MALPLYLAMTAPEMSSIDPIPANFAYMACHFSPYSQGLSNLPASLPNNAILILNDNYPCQSHSPGLVADQLNSIMDSFRCESLLLDFQRPTCPETEQMISTIISVVSRPVAVSAGHGAAWNGPVLLPPCPLHVPLEEYLRPWKGREIWLEAALCQEDASITANGASFIPHFPIDYLQGGFYDDPLCCHYHIAKSEEDVTFTLFDTWESLKKKLSCAQELGVARGIGLWQELGKYDL